MVVGGQRRWAGSVGGWQRWAVTLKPYFDFRFELGARKFIGLDTLKSKNDESTRWPLPAVSAGKIGDNRQMDS